MHDVYEDAVESGSDGASGLISLVVFFGIVWVVSKIYDSYKEDKKRTEEIKHDREISSKVASTTIQKHPDISKYQTRESWQKGFANATYDLSQNKVKPLVGKTVDDLIQEYRHLCEKGHMIQAESVMQQIGYYQKIEFDKTQCKKKQNKEKKTIRKNSTEIGSASVHKAPDTPSAVSNTIETDEYILSPDKKILLKGKDVEVIHVPFGVETIHHKAFNHLNLIKEVIIPNSVKVIGDWAFSSSSIEKVIIPSSVEKIGEYAFSGCRKLKEVLVSPGVKNLGIGVFESCYYLEKVSLPSTLMSIPDSCFFQCMSLKQINLPNGIKYIGDSAFMRCESLGAIYIPESVTEIGFEVFRQCYELKSIAIPSNIVGLSEYMFYNCI